TYIKGPAHHEGEDDPKAPKTASFGARFNAAFGHGFHALTSRYERSVTRALARPGRVTTVILVVSLASLALWPALGLAFFPRTDAGQFVINLKAPSGTRVEVTSQDIARVEQVIRSTIPAHDLKLVVSNIGVVPGFSSIYTSNSGPHTATVQVALADHASRSSFEYMNRVRTAL